MTPDTLARDAAVIFAAAFAHGTNYSIIAALDDAEALHRGALERCITHSRVTPTTAQAAGVL